MRRISGGMVAVKNSVCRVNGTSLQMRSMSGMKPISSMRSASSITKQFDAVEQQPPAFEMVEQTAGRRDQNIDAAGQLHVLVVERNAADQERDVELVIGAVLDEAFFDLRGELPRRLKNKRARHPRARPPAFQHCQHRQRERRRFPGAGLRDA